MSVFRIDLKASSGKSSMSEPQSRFVKTLKGSNLSGQKSVIISADEPATTPPRMNVYPENLCTFLWRLRISEFRLMAGLENG